MFAKTIARKSKNENQAIRNPTFRRKIINMRSHFQRKKYFRIKRYFFLVSLKNKLTGTERSVTYQWPGQFIGFKANFVPSTSNENILSFRNTKKNAQVNKT